MPLDPLPLIARMTQNMRDLDLLSMSLFEFIHLLSKQDIILGLIGVNDAELCLIALALQYPRNKLITRRDARASQDERDVAERHLSTFDFEFSHAFVCDIASWAADIDFLADGHTVEDVTHRAAGLVIGGEVGLYDKLEGAVLFVAENRSGRRVGADNHLVSEVESELDMLTCVQAESGFRVRESEGVGSGVFGDLLACFEGYRNPSVFLQRNVLVSLRLGFLLCCGFGVFLDESLGLFGNHAEDAFYQDQRESQ